MNRLNRWFAGTVLALALVGSGSQAAAADAQYWNAGQTLTVEPKMNFIPNTDVYYQRRAPGYDLYRHANRWYLVQEGNWHEARTWRGPFTLIDVANVPEGMIDIPETYRKHWDSGVQDYWASRRTFATKPKMTKITDKGVSYARQYSDFDLYRYKSAWYLMDDGVWYRSDSWKGPFLSTRTSYIPRVVLAVPDAYRRHWVVPAAR